MKLLQNTLGVTKITFGENLFLFGVSRAGGNKRKSRTGMIDIPALQFIKT